MNVKPSCPDCGLNPVVHPAEWISATVDLLTRPLFIISRFLSRLFSPVTSVLVKNLAPGLLKIGAALHIVTVTTDVDAKDNLRTRALWESAKKRGITITQFRLFGVATEGYFMATYGEEVIFFQGLPLPKNASTKSLDWIDDKGFIKNFFTKAGIPVAKGGTAFSFSQAEKIFKEINDTVIVKPRVGSRSRHTFLNITSVDALHTAFKSAKRLCPWVIVEQQLVGRVYRGTVIGGKAVAVVSRDPASVIGDGVSTVRALIEKENKNPLRQGPIFHEIPIDETTDAELALINLSLDSVPTKDQYVTVNEKVSRSFGASTTDVTDKTHADTIKMLEDIAKVLDTSLVGVDFIIEDVSKSWKVQNKCGVIECNSTPFIDLHHYPLYGAQRDVAGALWELVFPVVSNNSK